MDVDEEAQDDADDSVMELSMVDIRARVLAASFTEAMLMATLLEVSHCVTLSYVY
jgi:hypothetical protein